MSLWIAEQRTVKLCESGSTMKEGRTSSGGIRTVFLSLCAEARRGNDILHLAHCLREPGEYRP